MWKVLTIRNRLERYLCIKISKNKHTAHKTYMQYIFSSATIHYHYNQHDITSLYVTIISHKMMPTLVKSTYLCWKSRLTHQTIQHSGSNMGITSFICMLATLLKTDKTPQYIFIFFTERTCKRSTPKVFKNPSTKTNLYPEILNSCKCCLFVAFSSSWAGAAALFAFSLVKQWQGKHTVLFLALNKYVRGANDTVLFTLRICINCKHT